jgi:hypothetical protein
VSNSPYCAGVQDFETDESQWPISQPVEKLEGRVQCGGEAEYVNDIQPASGELHAAFVMTSRANCDIVAVDTAAALVAMRRTSPNKRINKIVEWMKLSLRFRTSERVN